MGLIPVVTEAGSEKDILEENVNSLFFQKKEFTDLSKKIKILTDKKKFLVLFNGVKKIKPTLNVKNAIEKVETIQSQL